MMYLIDCKRTMIDFGTGYLFIKNTCCNSSPNMYKNLIVLKYVAIFKNIGSFLMVHAESIGALFCYQCVLICSLNRL